MSTLKCIDNGDYKVSLVVGREYTVIPDKKAEQRGRVRVVDESGDSYLFPVNMFVVSESQHASDRENKSMGA